MTLAKAPRTPTRLVFLGTPEVAVPTLRALHEAGHDIALVVSRPDKRRGRGGSLTPSPVKAEALALGIPVTDDVADCLDVGADLGVVVAYGRLIKSEILEALPMVNLHFSLLPEWRGAAPVERAILAGDERTGVCLMALAEELDTGDLYRCREVEIEPDDTLDGLRDRLADIGAELLVDELRAGLDEPHPQIGEPTYAHKIDNDEHRLDLRRPAAELDRVIRLGRAWTSWRGRRLKIHEAGIEPSSTGEPGSIDGVLVATGEGSLRLVTVQPEGKKPMAADAWINGVQPSAADRLG